MADITYEDLIKAIQTKKRFKIDNIFYNSLFFGTKLELKALPNILKNEKLYYMAPGKVKGRHKLVVITSRRIILIDKKILNRGNITQVPLNKINGSHVNNGIFGSLVYRTGNDSINVIKRLWGNDVNRLSNALDEASDSFDKDIDKASKEDSEINYIKFTKNLLKEELISQEQLNKIQDYILK